MDEQDHTLDATRPVETRRAITFLREWRKFRHLNQEEAADLLLIDRTTLSRIETGKLPYNQDFLERAAVLYRCEPLDFLVSNPRAFDAPRLIYHRLKNSDESTQKKAYDIVEALLKVS